MSSSGQTRSNRVARSPINRGKSQTDEDQAGYMFCVEGFLQKQYAEKNRTDRYEESYKQQVCGAGRCEKPEIKYLRKSSRQDCQTGQSTDGLQGRKCHIPWIVHDHHDGKQH